MKREIENTYFEHTLKFYLQNPEKKNIIKDYMNNPLEKVLTKLTNFFNDCWWIVPDRDAQFSVLQRA